jgi:VWFA-related protein
MSRRAHWAALLVIPTAAVCLAAQSPDPPPHDGVPADQQAEPAENPPQTPSAEDSPIDQALTTFSNVTRLVALQVRVEGRSSSGLPRDAFAVYDNGRKVPVTLFVAEDAPITVGLVIDGSISMLPIRDLVLAGVNTFAETSHPDDELFAIGFNDKPLAVLPASAPFTSDLAYFRRALGERITARGRTALFDAVGMALDYVERGTREGRVLVVISDGGDNASETTFDEILRRTQSSNITIYAVALRQDPPDAESNPEVLRRLAAASGGVVLEPDTVRNVKEALQRIAADIRRSYILGFDPGDPDGAFHRIRVEASAPGSGRLRVRSRSGYLSMDQKAGERVAP